VTLSTHVLDTERGQPAVGVTVALVCDGQTLARGVTDVDGRIRDLGGSALVAGRYTLVFDVAAYFVSQGRPGSFLQRISVDFQTEAPDRHYHVPLLLSAYAGTVYRGS
jgi:hydroxyisourate hydrolase